MPLKEVKHTKYLGIHISHDLLKWNRNIDETTAKANHTLGFLKRNLQVNSPSLKAKAYKGLVCPKVEYCSSVWDLCLRVKNNVAYKIEMVQCRAAWWCLQR